MIIYYNHFFIVEIIKINLDFDFLKEFFLLLSNLCLKGNRLFDKNKNYLILSEFIIPF